MLKCLIVEDDKKKAEDIKEVLEKNFNVDITFRTSYKSGLKESLNPDYDVILLDMSMSTFDITSVEKGGRPRHFAGKEIIYQMQYRKIHTPVIIITQFDVFGDGVEAINLNDLINILEAINFEGYQETIFYKMIGIEWQEKLVNRIKLLENKELDK